MQLNFMVRFYHGKKQIEHFDLVSIETFFNEFERKYIGKSVHVVKL